LNWVRCRRSLDKASVPVLRTSKGFQRDPRARGFGERGTEGRIKGPHKYAREQKVPYLGICLGMQMAVHPKPRVTWRALNDCGSERIRPRNPAAKKRFETRPVYTSRKWCRHNHKVETSSWNDDKGGTMRSWCPMIATLKRRIARGQYYGHTSAIDERPHRHRYEVRHAYREKFGKAGLTSRMFARRHCRPKIVEWSTPVVQIASSFHLPELKSNLFDPHPCSIGLHPRPPKGNVAALV